MSALPADWTYKLALAVLDAAVSCEGVECERRFVSDGSLPEQPPPGCACQLIAVPTEGFEPLSERGQRQAGCGARRVAEIRLLLDLCTTAPPDDKSVPDPAKVNAQAQKNASTRWLMMVGIRKAHTAGQLSAIGEELGPLAGSTAERIRLNPWRLTRSTGGVARWEALIRFEDET